MVGKMSSPERSLVFLQVIFQYMRRMNAHPFGPAIGHHVAVCVPRCSLWSREGECMCGVLDGFVDTTVWGGGGSRAGVGFGGTLCCVLAFEGACLSGGGARKPVTPSGIHASCSVVGIRRRCQFWIRSGRHSILCCIVIVYFALSVHI